MRKMKTMKKAKTQSRSANGISEGGSVGVMAA
jgi:hypothetical protein